MQKCKVYGHRGARGLVPENTLFGYHVALEIGVDAVDMDVVMTKDDVIVVTHDLALNPNITRDEHGQWLTQENLFIRQLTFPELQKYDVGKIKPGTLYHQLFPQQRFADGIRIPALKEVIAFVKANTNKNVIFQIEIKSDPQHPQLSAPPKEFAEALVAILAEENILNQTEIQAFDYSYLLEIQKLNQEIATAFLTQSENNMDKFDAITKIADMGGKIWGPEDQELTPDLVKFAHQAGLKVVCWSWPEKSGKEIDIPLIKELIAMQVDGINTDKPDILRELINTN